MSVLDAFLIALAQLLWGVVFAGALVLVALVVIPAVLSVRRSTVRDTDLEEE